MARRTDLLLTSALGLVAALPGCQETPSYRVRWEIEQRIDPLLPDDTPTATYDVTKAYHCSQLGMTAVRVRAIDEAGSVASEDVFPCFAAGFEDPDEQVEGPQLRAGRYALEVQGLQRNLQEWIDERALAENEGTFDADEHCDLANAECSPWRVACDCQTFEVVEDETFSDFATFTLTPPDGCIDGIDNDVDGLVDGEDPGCVGQEAARGDCHDDEDNDDDGLIDVLDPGCHGVREDGDVSVVQFTLRATVLDENPVATCTGTGLTRFLVTAVGGDGEPIAVATTECRLGDPLFFSAELPGAEGLQIFVTGLAGDTPLTVPVDTGVEVTPGSNAIVDLVVDFGSETFDPPLVKSTKLFVAFSQHPDATADPRPSCEPGEWGLLTIDRLALRVVDLAGAPAGAVLSAPDEVQDAPLDGTPFACVSQVFTISELEWGGYRILGEALAADGTVCFASTEGQLLAPAVPASLVLDRVLVDGVPPPSCIDCTTDDDCGGDLVCDGSVCR